MSNRRGGFTLVELIVVIAVIGVIAAVTIIGLARFQADGRDSRRVTSATAIAEALEKYYDQNGEYPSCSTIQQSVTLVTSNVLKGLQASVLTAPDATPGTNSVSCSVLSYSSPTDFFEYLGDGSSDCLTTSCLYFALRYKDETNKTIKTVESRHSPAINEPENMTAVVNSSTQVTVSWDAADNASGYVLERSTSDTFPAGLSTTSYSQTPIFKVFTDEAPGITHYYRVATTSGPNTSRWSDIVSATPAPVAPTGLGATNTGGTYGSQLVSWTASTNATSYNIERATNSSFTGAVMAATGVTSTSKTITGLSQGITHYYRVYAVAGGVSSTASSPASRLTGVAPPAAFTITCTTNTSSITCTSNAVCAAGTIPEYGWMTEDDDFGSSTEWKTYTHTPPILASVTISNISSCLSPENGSGSGIFASNTGSYTRPVPKPTINTLEWNGSRVWAKWNNVCGGIYQLSLVQGSFSDTDYPHWNASNNPWTSSGVVEMQSSENDTRAWGSFATVTYKVKAKCSGTWGSYSSGKSASP